MADHNFEGQEIDLLIQELAKPATKPSPAKPFTFAPSTTASPSPSAVVAVATPMAGPTDSMRAPLPTVTIPPRQDRSARTSRVPAQMMKLAQHSLPAWVRRTRAHWQARPHWLRFPRALAVKRPENIVRGCVALGVALCVAMPYWPYPKACAAWLVFYFFAINVVVIAGIWAARLTWVSRQAVAHVVALGIVLWGITLAAEETLGLGYAKAEAIWFCQW